MCQTSSSVAQIRNTHALFGQDRRVRMDTIGQSELEQLDRNTQIASRGDAVTVDLRGAMSPIATPGYA